MTRLPSAIDDTIIARASAPGGAIRGILRISGRHAVAVTEMIIEISDEFRSQQRPACIDTHIILPPHCAALPPIPAKLLLWQAGHSYTGDETVEIHTIGSPVLLDAIMAALLSVSDDVRLAEPGEFTLRAFLSGRLDLAQAEAVLGVIDAANDMDLKTALHQLAGNVSAPLSAVRMLLLDTLSQLEASLDFADEEIPALPAQALRRTLTEALEQIEQLRQKITRRGIDGSKPKIVITGLPNAGKSTLFNKLVQREAALVSPLAGTTRDYLEAETDWEGISVVLMDTAGIGGGTLDELDESAQRKAKELLEQADVLIHCYEDVFHAETQRAEAQRDKEGETRDSLFRAPVFLYEKTSLCEKTIFFQTKTPNESLDSLIKAVSTLLRRSPDYGMLPNTALRCREVLLSAGESLARATDLPDSALVALELRNAVNQLGLIDGTIHTEDILDNIFSRFCIGK